MSENNAVKAGGLSKNTLIIGAVVAVIVLWGISAYNGMVKEEEKATTSWAAVQSAYQRRADLIPNLVEVVKGYAAHEQGTFEAVVNARAKATSINVDAEDLTPEKLEQFQKAQGELSQALGRLIAVQEAYPDLKANENFRDLQVQLEGTENRINEARNAFNSAVQDYNVKIRKFPGTILAGLFGFDKMSKFEADAAAQNAPQVKF
ncbi:MAG: LemA family protein [Prevotella sp.]|nr:LemA family protein [Prevotella sp.]